MATAQCHNNNNNNNNNNNVSDLCFVSAQVCCLTLSQNLLYNLFILQKNAHFLIFRAAIWHSPEWQGAKHVITLLISLCRNGNVPGDFPVFHSPEGPVCSSRREKQSKTIAPISHFITLSHKETKWTICPNQSDQLLGQWNLVAHFVLVCDETASSAINKTLAVTGLRREGNKRRIKATLSWHNHGWMEGRMDGWTEGGSGTQMSLEWLNLNLWTVNLPRCGCTGSNPRSLWPASIFMDHKMSFGAQRASHVHEERWLTCVCWTVCWKD